MHWVFLATVLTLLGTGISFTSRLGGTPWMWIVMGLSQVPVAAVSVHRLIKEGEAREALQPRWGDISLGMGSALLLLLLGWLARMAVAPSGTVQQGWLFRAYLQAGDPRVLQDHWGLVLVGVVALAALAELGWRGLVVRQLEERLGTRRAWLAGGLLYGLSFLPTAWWLRGEAGPNPLIVGAAVLGGLVWSFLAARTQRLVPSVLSHAVFLWFAVVQFPLLALGQG